RISRFGGNFLVLPLFWGRWIQQSNGQSGSSEGLSWGISGALHGQSSWPPALPVDRRERSPPWSRMRERGKGRTDSSETKVYLPLLWPGAATTPASRGVRMGECSS